MTFASEVRVMNKYIIPKVNTYSLPEFQKKCGTEAECEEALFHLKWNNGFVCQSVSITIII